MGRLKTVRKPGNAGTFPDAEYVYSVTKSSSALRAEQTAGPQQQSDRLLRHLRSGLLRLRQSQTTAPDAKRVITDTQYDGRGLTVKSSVFHNIASGPTSTLYTVGAAADLLIERQQRFVYDGVGRQLRDELWKQNIKQFETTTQYQGDRTTMIPPTGGTLTQDLTNARGQVVERRLYVSPTTLTPPFDRTLYGYDDAGRLISVKDPLNNEWTYKYNLLGQKYETVDPDTGTSVSTFDNAGQVTSTKNALDQYLYYFYDKLGRKTKQTSDAAGATVMASWAYDTVDKGQLTSSSRVDGANTYTTSIGSYDDGYRPETITSTIPEFGTAGGTLTYTVTNGYKTNGALATQDFPTVGGLPAEVITHTYSNEGFQTSLSTPTTTYINAAEYHYDGLLYREFLGAAGKQVRLTNEYDPTTRRLSKLLISTESQTTSGSFVDPYEYNYGYDNAGNITSVAGKVLGAADQEECFRYDHVRRLTEAWTQVSGACTTPQRTGADPYWRQWTFDAIGNRKTQKDLDTVDTDWTYQVGAAGAVKPHQLKQVTATGPKAGTALRSFGYDTAGNTTTFTTPTGVAQTLQWDLEGHLFKVIEGTNNTSYVYDPSGNRLLSKAPTASTLYLPGGLELEKLTSGGSVLGTRYYTDATGRNVAVRNASGLKWTCADHNGTSTVQVDSVTVSSTRRRSMPYGETRGSQPAFVGTKGYVGGTVDATGLTHLGAREYDPTLGRFVSRDLIMDPTDPQQTHGYSYSRNSPITYSDPSGLRPTCDNEGNTTCAPPVDPREVPDPNPDDDKPAGPTPPPDCHTANSCEGKPNDPCAVAPNSDLCKALTYIANEINVNSGSPEVEAIAKYMGQGCSLLDTMFGVCSGQDRIQNGLLMWFVLVCPGCRWDHKPMIVNMWNGQPSAVDPITGSIIFHDIFSNIHYGYVGIQAAIDGPTLQMVNTKTAGDMKVFGQYEASDTISTQIGIDLAATHLPGQVTTQVLYEAIMARAAEYVATTDLKIIR